MNGAIGGDSMSYPHVYSDHERELSPKRSFVRILTAESTWRDPIVTRYFASFSKHFYRVPIERATHLDPSTLYLLTAYFFYFLVPKLHSDFSQASAGYLREPKKVDELSLHPQKLWTVNCDFLNPNLFRGKKRGWQIG